MSAEEPQSAPQDASTPAPVGTLGVLGSVFRAWFGVQSEEKRQRDFASGNARPFIIAGIIFVVIMVIGVIVAVNLAISASTP